MVNRGWEDEEGSALYCTQEDLYWLPSLVGQGYSKLDLVCSAHQLPQQKSTPWRCFLASQDLGTELRLKLYTLLLKRHGFSLH